MLTIACLFYGNNLDLAARCLGGLDRNLERGRPFLADIRLGLNDVSPGAADYVQGWAEEVSSRHALPVLTYRPERNAYKYPLMRRMLYGDVPGHRLGDLFMWGDDDFYLEPNFDWKHMLDFMSARDMIGHVYRWFVQGQQAAWVARQSWYDPAVGKPELYRGRPKFTFAQGSWWVIRTAILKKYDWPIPQLKHNGGDALLGELLRQQKLRLGHYAHRVRVNADDEGRNSKAKRRGFSEPPLGKDLAASLNRNLDFQNFKTDVRVYTSEGWHDLVM